MDSIKQKINHLKFLISFHKYSIEGFNKRILLISMFYLFITNILAVFLSPFFLIFTVIIIFILTSLLIINIYSYSIRCNYYKEFGFIKKSTNEQCSYIKNCANKYFNECAEILEITELKYEFTKTEAELLKLNGMKINNEIIINH